MSLLILPWPPTANLYWRMWRNRMVLSTEGRAYKATVALMAKRLHIPKWAGLVCVELRYFRPRKIGDLDNRLKCTLDSLNGICWKDDAQVREIHAYLGDDKANPRVEVVARELANLEGNAHDE